MHLKLLDKLKALHARLEHEVRAERARRMPDEVRLKRLKRAKLRVKDRLYGLVPA